MKMYLLGAVGLFFVLSGIMLLYVKDRRYYLYEMFIVSSEYETYLKKLSVSNDPSDGLLYRNAETNIFQTVTLQTGIYGGYHDMSNRIPKFTRYGYPYTLGIRLSYTSNQENELIIKTVSIYKEAGQLILCDNTEKRLKFKEEKRGKYVADSDIKDLYLPHVDLKVEIEIKDATENKTAKVVFHFKAETRKESSSSFIDRIMSI